MANPMMATVPAIRASPAKIVLVEDNADARRMLKSLLELDGYQVIAEEDGRHGVDAILREKPDVALVDIGLPELDLGTVPAWGGTARLSRCVGRDQALDMILRAKKIDGEHALRIGLVHELHPVEGLKSAAHALALELAAMPPRAVAGVLRCVVGAGDAPLDEALAETAEAVGEEE